MMTNLKIWGRNIEPHTILQAERSARSPVVDGHVALMPDAHVGIGATVGSVIPTKNAIIPAAVGVDIGCGMIAVETDLSANDLPDDLQPLVSRFGRSVPAGVGHGRNPSSRGTIGRRRFVGGPPRGCPTILMIWVTWGSGHSSS